MTYITIPNRVSHSVIFHTGNLSRLGSISNRRIVCIIQPRMLQRGMNAQTSVGAHHQQITNKIFGFRRNRVERRVVHVPVAVSYILECLVVVGAAKWRQATEKNVSEHADRPHVRVESHRSAQHDFGRSKLGSSSKQKSCKLLILFSYRW